MPNSVVILSKDTVSSKLIEDTLVKEGYKPLIIEPITFEQEYTSLSPRYVFIDLLLGDLDAIELMHFLAQMHCETPIVLMGEIDERVLASATRVGEELNLNIIGFLHKPFDENNILEIISAVNPAHLLISSDQLANAIERNELILYYQPKLEVKTGRITGVEALIRWKPPETSIIHPSAFITLAEESGLIIPITYWCIREAIHQIQVWKSEHHLDLKVAINLSSKTLTNTVLPDEIEKLCNEYSISADKLCFEITESVAMGNLQLINEILTRMRLKGYFLSIDDFGTGYSSLIELQRLPFNEVKIDQSFVKKVTLGKGESIISRAIIALSRNLGMISVAEGVENAETKKWLEDNCCDVLQGYYISPPLPSDSFITWMKNNTDENQTFKE